MTVLVSGEVGAQSGGGSRPAPKPRAEFQNHNDELAKAGVAVGAGRVYSSSKGKRVRFDGRKRTVIDGPSAEAKELVGGYWLWQVRSMDEAVEWLKRAPFDGGIFEIREIFQTEEALSR